MEISWTTLWRIFWMLLFVAALFLVKDVLIILFLAIVISSALDTPVSYLERKKIPRILGAILIFIAVLMVLALILYTIIPISIVELKNFLDNLNKIKMPVFGSFDTSFLLKDLGTRLDALTDDLFSGKIPFLNIISSVFGNLALIIATFVLSFYLTINRQGVEKFLRAILPLTQEEYVINVYLRTRKKLGLWLQGQIFLMLIVGLATFLGLWILGVKYSLILGILAGLLEIVPIAGPVFSGTIAFLIAISESLSLGIYVIALFVFIQQLESHLLVPMVMKKTIGISPVVVVISLLAGAQIAGLIGAILAVPIAVVFQEILADWEKRKLRESSKKLI